MKAKGAMWGVVVLSAIIFASLTALPVPGAEADRRIVLDLSDERLCAIEGSRCVLDAKPLRLGTVPHPVKAGEYRVQGKIRRLPCVVGSDAAVVVWILDLGSGVTAHGQHIKKRMGMHHLHNAIVLRNDDAEALWEWAAVGVPVSVRE